MADIRAEPPVVNSFVSNIIEATHLSECNCKIDPNGKKGISTEGFLQ